ncbi:MAG: Asp-tRNA(Asn)/Glu-tRNA(Gln) amidotransferase subunit GatB [Oscillospiraceae bacterium]|jgi:aspartyl-tRNA(Asn)/glutamyl-tRNA(Gln) amidotransferase subunit B|nr:Asp-tRNA(Asn)/Glu-tRNA(Gln) amidotransferase subunit GatB [Oscillospiraceae bacterium]
MVINMKWESVIGLETHVELSTRTKIFCGCTTDFGGEPNTHCCPVCTGQPGSLPVLNRTAVEYAALAGLALGCEIHTRSIMARKHYVYPDLPKAYQTSQFDRPLCTGGGVTLSNGRRIDLTRIHIEEDAGKLVHTNSELMIDYNRGGVPLIEIVTEPDFRSAAEAVEYMERLQTTLRAIGVSDCRMQEGSMRCDVNISLRRPGDTALGVRSEVKNLNSFTAVAAAIEYEYGRQAELLEAGELVMQDTRAYDANTGATVSMRDKENADDYRYFPEPDIVPAELTRGDIERLRESLPELPESKLRRYTEELGVAESDARLLTKYRLVSEYFECAARVSGSAGATASFIVTQMFAHISTESERERWSPKADAEALGELLGLVRTGKISRETAKRAYAQMAESGGRASDFISEADMEGISAEDLARLCGQAVEENPKPAADFRAGREKALQALVGAVMRQTRGRADAKAVEAQLRDILPGD